MPRVRWGTGPVVVVLKVVPVTDAAFASPWANECAPVFFHTHYYYWYDELVILIVVIACMFKVLYDSIIGGGSMLASKNYFTRYHASIRSSIRLLFDYLID